MRLLQGLNNLKSTPTASKNFLNPAAIVGGGITMRVTVDQRLVYPYSLEFRAYDLSKGRDHRLFYDFRLRIEPNDLENRDRKATINVWRFLDERKTTTNSRMRWFRHESPPFASALESTMSYRDEMNNYALELIGKAIEDVGLAIDSVSDHDPFDNQQVGPNTLRPIQRKLIL